MDTKIITQVVREIKRSLQNWDTQKAIKFKNYTKYLQNLQSGLLKISILLLLLFPKLLIIIEPNTNIKSIINIL